MKHQEIIQSTLMIREQHAVRLFLHLFYGVSLSYDMMYYYIVPMLAHQEMGIIEGGLGYWTYVIRFGFLPVAIYFIRNNQVQVVKYFYFIANTILLIINELLIYKGNNIEYESGNFSELIIILCSPIFVNKGFFWLVSLGSIAKYMVVGFVIQSSDAIPFIILFIIAFSIIGYIFITRFQGYMDRTGAFMLNHTIRNEILKISVCAENISSSPEAFNNQTTESIEIIVNAADHMLEMVTRINAQMQEVRLYEMPTSLNDLIDRTLQALSPELELKKVSIEKNYACDIEIYCDKIHIREVLSNLIKNAIESMKEGGTIDVKLYKNKRKVVLLIKDTGEGISKPNLGRVFEPFFTTKKRTLNFGLGLSYCYTVMQKSGGSLEIQSTENLGTTVFIKFPVKKMRVG